MQITQEKTLILTLKLDDLSQAFFDGQRKLYFPPERNQLRAHLTLFHQLPDQPDIISYLTGLQVKAFDLQISGLMNLGAGVAYRVESPELAGLHRSLSKHFANLLIPQEKQGFRPHLTIMNKATPDAAKALLGQLAARFQPFHFTGTGLNLWTYLDGPWAHRHTINFTSG